jgi:fructose-1,6-bisphosphatase/inositol monophosphatase family enzyme
MGLCDLVAEADLKPYDYMALVPIITGAGGVITDWRVRESMHARACSLLSLLRVPRLYDAAPPPCVCLC